MNCLRSLGSRDRGFESHLGHGYSVCGCVYSVFVLSCIYIEALGRADHSSKGSYQLRVDPKRNENLDTVRVRYKSKDKKLKSMKPEVLFTKIYKEVKKNSMLIPVLKAKGVIDCKVKNSLCKWGL
jgi:hypothetical protein